MSQRKTIFSLIFLLVFLLQPLSLQAGVKTNQIEDYLKKMGAVYASYPESANTFVISFTSPNEKAEKVTVFVVNDESKDVLDCYAYADLKLQNIKFAADRAEVMTRLLKLNHKAFGAFFVDEEGDIGVRFTFTTENGVGFEAFKTAVETLRRIADNATPTINRMLTARNNRAY